MVHILSKLNGWQRLWFVFSILSLVLTICIVIVAPKPEYAVEDPDIIARLNKDETYRVNIPNIGIVSFPNSLSDKEVGNWIDKYYNSNRDTIPKIASYLINQRNQTDAAKAQMDNADLKSSYLSVMGLYFLIWLSTVTVVYLFGFSIGWIYRGFKKKL